MTIRNILSGLRYMTQCVWCGEPKASVACYYWCEVEL